MCPAGSRPRRAGLLGIRIDFLPPALVVLRGLTPLASSIYIDPDLHRAQLFPSGVAYSPALLLSLGPTHVRGTDLTYHRLSHLPQPRVIRCPAGAHSNRLLGFFQDLFPPASPIAVSVSSC
jgi:hypothetical protein